MPSCVYTYINMSVCVDTSVTMYIYMYVYIHVYIYVDLSAKLQKSAKPTTWNPHHRNDIHPVI